MKRVGVKIDRLNNDFFILGTNAYYKFNEQSGQLIDYKNNNNSNVLVNIQKNQPGLITNTTSYRFTGNSYIEIPNSSDFVFTDGQKDIPFSIEILFSLNSIPSEGFAFVNKRVYGQGISNGWQLNYRFGRIALFLFGFNSIISTSLSVDLQLNKKYHLICTYNGSKKSNGINIYLNSINSIDFRGSDVENDGNNNIVHNYSGLVDIGASVQIGHRVTNFLNFNGKMQILNIAKDKEYNQKEVKSLFRNGNVKYLL